MVAPTTIALFGILAAIPFLRPYLRVLKVGELEVQFRNLKEEDQILVFLDGIARRKPWTFYEGREEEGQLGEAFLALIETLESQSKEKLNKKLKEWLGSGDANLIWFASEVIGYREFGEFKPDLLKIIEESHHANDLSRAWPEWTLNCKWASSIFDNFKSLNELLLATNNFKNQKWLLKAYEQMLDTYTKNEHFERWQNLRQGLEEFVSQSQDPNLKATAETLLKSSA